MDQATDPSPGPGPDATQRPCGLPSCPKAGPLRCARCRDVYYCSPACQKAHWTQHKPACRKPTSPGPGAAAPSSSTGADASASAAPTGAHTKANCHLIRAGPAPTRASIAADAAARIEPFPLAAYGSERGERAELTRRLGWAGVDEAAKFYGREGSDAWYYYGYGPGQAALAQASRRRMTRADRPFGPLYNGLVSRLTGREVYGDVAVVRSGPAGEDGYAEEFTKEELVATAVWYVMEDQRPDAVFAEREKSRVLRKMGAPAGWGDVPSMHF